MASESAETKSNRQVLKELWYQASGHIYDNNPDKAITTIKELAKREKEYTETCGLLKTVSNTAQKKKVYGISPIGRFTTLLCAAAGQDQYDVVYKLLDLGANPNIPDDEGYLPMGYSMTCCSTADQQYQGNEEMALALLDAGLKFEGTPYNGITRNWISIYEGAQKAGMDRLIVRLDEIHDVKKSAKVTLDFGKKGNKRMTGVINSMAATVARTQK